MFNKKLRCNHENDFVITVIAAIVSVARTYLLTVSQYWQDSVTLLISVASTAADSAA